MASVDRLAKARFQAIDDLRRYGGTGLGLAISRKLATPLIKDVIDTAGQLAEQNKNRLVVDAPKRTNTRDEGGPFGFGNQVPISSHCKLLRSKAVVVNVAEMSGR